MARTCRENWANVGDYLCPNCFDGSVYAGLKCLGSSLKACECGHLGAGHDFLGCEHCGCKKEAV